MVLLQPESSGLVCLASSDPFAEPKCTVGYLKSERDRAVLRTGLRLAIRLAETMRALGYPLSNVHVPAGLDDAALDAHTVRWAGSYFHYSSSCRMAAEDDPHAPGVVDDMLRVHGVDGLRVCDASIFPDVLATHIQAPIVAIAEKCADMIKSSYDV